jgi:sodium-dependent dicarboxylate transporter 2/3/5
MMSMWVSNTATTAMMLPVALGVIRTLERMRGDQDLARGQPWPFASSVLLMIAYAASIGGVGTPVGSPPNLICIGLIGALAQVEISFFKWMALAVPMLVIMCPVLYLLLQVAQRQSTLQPGGHHDLQQYLRDERAALGSWSPGQINTLLAFLLAIALWLLPGVLSVALKPDHPWRALSDSRLPESVVALVAAILLFMLPVNWRERKFTLTWEEAVKIDWGTILLFGGGLSLGTLMFKTGVAEALGHAVADRLGAQSLWTITATSIALGIVISETTSNTAAANMIIPVAIALAQAAGVSPVPPALGACFGASFGFMLPVSTPPNAIVYSSRLVPITKMIKTGIAFDILGFFIVLGSLRVLCPLLGLSE